MNTVTGALRSALPESSEAAATESAQARAERRAAEGIGPYKLDPQKQAELNELKRETRFHNEHYFRAHPELRAAIKAFTDELLEKKPDDVQAFAQAFFTDPGLPTRLGLPTQ